MVNIGIFGENWDFNVLLLKRKIEEMRHNATVINLYHFPSKTTMYVREKKIIYNNINLMNIDAFYIKKLGYHLPIVQKKFSKDEWLELYGKFNQFQLNERQKLLFVHSIIRILEAEKFVINPYNTFMYHDLKPLQYALFLKNKLPLPPFIAGNDERELKSFWKEYEAVCKPIDGSLHVEYVRDFMLKEADTLKVRPVTFQRYVKGKIIRAYVIRNDFICAAQTDSGSHADSKIEQKDFTKIELPEKVKKLAIKANKLLGMHFSGVDFIYSEEEDKYYLLECNPSPNFYPFDVKGTTNFSTKIAEYLIENAC